jgi:Zn-dependent M28 family amino/carboxypeptidase
MRRGIDDPEGCARAASWLAGALEQAGLAVTAQPYTALGASFQNVLAGPAAGSPGPLLVIGAHYDTVPGSPGADDNASGVAVLLELARLLGREAPPQLLLAAFCTEEVQGTDDKGSFALARLLQEQGRRVAGMLSLEMVGYFDDAPGSQRFPLPGMGAFYPTRGNFLAVVSDFGAWRFSLRTAASLRRAGRVPVRTFCGPAAMPGIHWSDHASFRRLGVPAAMLTDTAFHRNPHYHRGSDLPGTLDYERMAELARMLARGAAPRRPPSPGAA